MTNLNGRVRKLEEQAGQGVKPWLVLKQDLDNPMLYRDNAGNEYSRVTNWPEDNYNLLLVHYGDWR